MPFEIDEMEFSTWLYSFTKMDDLTICERVFQVLETLNYAYPPEKKLIKGRTRLFFLEKLSALLTASTANLTYLANLGDTDDKTETSFQQDTIPIDLSVWSTLELANAFSQLSTEDLFKDDKYYSIEEKSSILTNGLQALGKALLYISQTYTKPYVYFWHKCFQFYRLAQANQLTEADENPHGKAIDTAFKRILVFELSNTNQFSPAEMRSIYELLGHYADYASLLVSVPKKKFKGIPSIQLNGNEPPAIAEDDTENPDPHRVYIATVTVASKILEATNDRRAHHLPTDRLMLLRLAKTLTLNKQRKSPREISESQQLGIIGVKNIVEFLQAKEIEKQNILAELGAFDPSRPGELRELNLEIAGNDDDNLKPDFNQGIIKKRDPSAFNVVEFTDPADIWKVSSKQKKNYKANMQLVDKSLKGYGLLWTDNLIKPRVGSLVGIMHESLTIGLIRWLAQSKETGIFMGVELLGPKATTVKITNPGYPDEPVTALYLPAEHPYKEAASLIFSNKSFRPNEFVFLYKNHKNVRYRLTKQLHLTTFVNHYEVIRSY